ncbi:hypothetical protein FOPG_19378 [Fusarium oxysporum f. sp. conglutinans race 2 54008]|uniref:Uncharacterized protein n=1 Tax=Fusarium oxysporum f. sp. conglutinans race 2 54008 TaxID=1089457 RepID=X0GX10_FUSOX|nr:hypothetical protein FOPG_19378 [Fusarium oxysporum f. sp. conglutinans race 2 54008]
MHVGRIEPRQPRMMVRPLLLSSTNLRAKTVIEFNGRSARRRVERYRCGRSFGQGAFLMLPVLSSREECKIRNRKALRRSCRFSGHHQRTPDSCRRATWQGVESIAAIEVCDRRWSLKAGKT